MYADESCFVKVVQSANGAAIAGENPLNLQSWHDLTVEQVEGRHDLMMQEVANVKHTHKMLCTNLTHLLLELPRH
jgi:hypothetical protein